VHQRIFTLVFALGLLLPGVAAAAADFNGDILIELDGALAQNDRGGEADGKPLTVMIMYRDGRQYHAWAYGMRFNRSMHDVVVRDIEITPDAITLDLKIDVRRDLFIAGGSAAYEVTLRRLKDTGPRQAYRFTWLNTRSAAERLEGTVSGRFVGPEATHEVKDQAAVGMILDAPPVDPGYEPIGPQEYPRMLLRGNQLPEIRRRLDTPLGKAILARLEASPHEVAKGLLYALTKDPAYARAAFEIASRPERLSPDARTMGYGGNGGEHDQWYLCGHYATVAYAYDLCRGGWTEAEREQIEKFLAAQCAYAKNTPWGYANTGHSAPGRGVGYAVYGGGGIMSLPLWGIPGPPPKKPEAREAHPAFRNRPDWMADQDIDAELEAYGRRLADYTAGGGMNLAYYDFARHFHAMNILNLLHGPGEGGHVRDPMMLDYAIAFRNVFGQRVWDRRELADSIVQPVLEGQRLDGPTLARYCGLADEKWLPLVKHVWLDQVGMKDADLKTEQGARAFLDKSGLSGNDPMALFHCLRFFPLELEAKGPEHLLPLVWEQLPEQYLVLRNKLSGPDVVTTAMTSWPNGDTVPGQFQIMGFGHVWAKGEHGLKAYGPRERRNVVVLPEILTAAGWSGEATRVWTSPETGSGFMSVRLDEMYREIATKWVEQTKRDGRLVVKESKQVEYAKDVGVDAERHFAVDYSGEAGAPALYVVSDRVTGDHEKLWTLTVPGVGPDRKRTQPPPKVEIDGSRFTIRLGDASLTGVFLAPADVNIQRVAKNIDNYKWESKGNTFWRQVMREGLAASGPDGTQGDFLVVMTLQRGDPPPIEIQAPGMDGVVRVGGRTIRFDAGRPDGPWSPPSADTTP